MELRFFPINVFRETPKVTFFDAGIDASNGSDVIKTFNFRYSYA